MNASPDEVNRGQHDRTHKEHRIHERAFFLWQEAGSPEGREADFWHQAEELESEASSPWGEDRVAAGMAPTAAGEIDPNIVAEPVEAKAAAARAAKADTAKPNAAQPGAPKATKAKS